MCKGSENATHDLLGIILLGIKGVVLRSSGKSELRPTLAYFQVRSRDISIEEWKGSETYSPSTAYGKTQALTPSPLVPLRGWVSKWAPREGGTRVGLEGRVHRCCRPTGVDFLVPVMGYICRICHKFYHSNSGAQLSHCKSLAHFENLQVSQASCPTRPG